jgi:hypothetical protein
LTIYVLSQRHSRACVAADLFCISIGTNVLVYGLAHADSISSNALIGLKFAAN